jgi:predicted RNA-binding Zn-ribbon protein involved in translation (DUF1610 family)
MPKLTDSDLNKAAEQNIIWTQNVDCPECGATTDAEFDTGKKDEDSVKCPNCGTEWDEEYTGWVNYGDA